mmetsp:Transcript_41211/g.102534  ORF Transcript_41211/g.102534 Transcript_41211/m.102534 type:complete len:258 (-) Transcript_41211:625-1398(-)
MAARPQRTGGVQQHWQPERLWPRHATLLRCSLSWSARKAVAATPARSCALLEHGTFASLSQWASANVPCPIPRVRQGKGLSLSAPESRLPELVEAPSEAERPGSGPSRARFSSRLAALSPSRIGQSLKALSPSRWSRKQDSSQGLLRASWSGRRTVPLSERTDGTDTINPSTPSPLKRMRQRIEALSGQAFTSIKAHSPLGRSSRRSAAGSHRFPTQRTPIVSARDSEVANGETASLATTMPLPSSTPRLPPVLPRL